MFFMPFDYLTSLILAFCVMIKFNKPDAVAASSIITAKLKDDYNHHMHNNTHMPPPYKHSLKSRLSNLLSSARNGEQVNYQHINQSPNHYTMCSVSPLELFFSPHYL